MGGDSAGGGLWIHSRSTKHAPVPQTSRAVVHWSPHPPQLFTSVWELTQSWLQSVWLAGQPHWPLWQVDPVAKAEHAFEQLPQLALSVSRLTHVVPHTDRPEEHLHAPPEQVAPVIEQA